jgi:hypothetical protein
MSTGEFVSGKRRICWSWMLVRYIDSELSENCFRFMLAIAMDCRTVDKKLSKMKSPLTSDKIKALVHIHLKRKTFNSLWRD